MSSKMPKMPKVKMPKAAKPTKIPPGMQIVESGKGGKKYLVPVRGAGMPKGYDPYNPPMVDNADAAPGASPHTNDGIDQRPELDENASTGIE